MATKPEVAYSPYLEILPRSRMAEGRTIYWLRGHEGERNNCFSKTQLVGKKNARQNILYLLKLD